MLYLPNAAAAGRGIHETLDYVSWEKLTNAVNPSLLSDCVARFALEADKAQRVDCLVRARSLYVMKNAAR